MKVFCGILGLGLMAACNQEPEPFDFDNHEFESELETIQPVLEGLLWPSDMTISGGGLTFIERDALTVHQVLDDTVHDSWEWGETPLQLLTIEDSTWVRTESGIYPLEGNGAVVEAEDITDIFELNGILHWVTSSEPAQVENETGIILESDSPIDSTIVVDNTLFVLDRASKKLMRVSEDGATEAFRFGDEPRRLFADGDTLYATTRSARWPYGGWIVKLEGSEDSWSETRLSDSPPEAERLLVHDGFVYWSSKQSITRISTGDGTYEMVAPNTTVGAMHVQENTLWWTDSKGGRLFALPL